MAMNLEWLANQPLKTQERILKQIKEMAERESHQKPPQTNLELIPIEIDTIVYYIPRAVSDLIDSLYQMTDGLSED